MSDRRWVEPQRAALEVIERSGIRYSPVTTCFTPGAPYPRSTTPPGALPAAPDLRDFATTFYVHVPYCTRTCSFCPFYTRRGQDVPDAYVDGILRHLDLVDRHFELPETLSLHFGGGSPNLLSLPQLARITRRFATRRLTRANIELHPECGATPGYVGALTDLGFSHVSVGLQSSEEEVLHATARGHDADALRRLTDEIGTTSLDLNVDVMYGGLYGETEANAVRTFRFVFEELRPRTVNAYRVGYQRGVPEYDRFRRHPERYPNTAEIFEITALLYDTAAAAGYSFYGMNYFVREPAHLPEMPRLATLGVGAGTYSRIVDQTGGTGFVSFAPFDTARYLEALRAPELPVERTKRFDGDYLRRWAALFDLKARRPLTTGLPDSLLEGLAALGLLTGRDDGHLMTDAGLLLEDLVAAALLPPALWEELSRRRRDGNYPPDESRYDWFFDPDVVLSFLAFVGAR